jgi:CheY-like chemotaxis protein
VTVSRLNIILVEDDNIIAMEVSDRLEAMGHNVMSIIDKGEQAVKEVLEKKPDLVFMDIRLEGKMDGIDAAQKIHAQQNTPIIYLTAYSDETTLQRAKLTNPAGYMLKPFINVELHIKVTEILDKMNHGIDLM